MPYADPQKYKEYQRAYYRANAATIKARSVSWRRENKERRRKTERARRLRHLDRQRERSKSHAAAYRKRHPDKIRALKRGKRLERAVSLSVWRVLAKGQGKKHPSFQMLGYSSDTLKTHLERQFTKGMTWANYGKFWEIDHIRPVSSFPPTEEGARAAWSLPNLRPLGSRENREKSDKSLYLI